MVVNHFSASPIVKLLDFSVELAKEKSVEILLGLVDLIDYIHSQGVVHQDITLDHVLVNALGRVHLIDFHAWDDTERVSPASDFCGWRAVGLHLPSIYEDEIVASGRSIALDEIVRAPKGFGVMLNEVINVCHVEGSLRGKLENIGSYLTTKSDQFVEHPKSRDFISSRLRKMLQAV